MKLTIESLKNLIREALMQPGENPDKRPKLDQYVSTLAAAAGRDYNEVISELGKQFGWVEVLRLLKDWKEKDHQYYIDLDNFAKKYNIREFVEKFQIAQVPEEAPRVPEAPKEETLEEIIAQTISEFK